MTAEAPILQCLNCRTSDEAAPLVQWRYQGRNLWICADCLPLIIHKRHQLSDKLSGPAEPVAEAQR